jgi:hypothetical protein
MCNAECAVQCVLVVGELHVHASLARVSAVAMEIGLPQGPNTKTYLVPDQQTPKCTTLRLSLRPLFSCLLLQSSRSLLKLSSL